MSEHLHYQEQTPLKEMNFYMRTMNENQPFGGSSDAPQESQQPRTLDRHALKRRAARLNARKEELGIPSITELKRGGSHVLLGATVLVQETQNGRELTVLDPKIGLDQRLVEDLPASLAPQRPQPIAPIVFERLGTNRRFVLGVAHESDPETIARLSGQSALTPASHLGRLTLDGKQFSPKAGEALALGVAHLGQDGLERMVTHLTAHETGLRLARK
jgi:hypothetical protein